ncbi:SRPBCC family protein [Robertkochia solimangrovi]|uniref:SRPBCC family protein n=1 Tax=Robertkochia solimangrovi TaxID=2213046 RepID=UPI00117EC6DB|nr:SRPBCC family protein [Robertkochia solimangrovi]TRZ41266.1 polyketide cyclase [Robertkochia solimangrovi]
MSESNSITVQTQIKAPVDKVWEYWTTPEHIINWNNASDDWHTPKAEVDLKVGGRFTSRMEAKDGSFGFDFGGEYTEVTDSAFIAYVMDDGRHVSITFDSEGGETTVTETFDPENQNPLEMQRQGWQAILDNFKKYTEKEF